MWSTFLTPFIVAKFLALITFASSVCYVHLRGRVRHKLARQITDHSTFMAPYNALMYVFSTVRNEPILDVTRFPELACLQANWQVIRDEAARLYTYGHISHADRSSDLAFGTFFKRGWTRFYVKWYDDPLPSAMELCPHTTALVQSIPSVNAALFAVLPPHSKLGQHRDPFAGSLRYHLGLVTPNSDDCRIFVDEVQMAWHDGQDFLFDETYIHSVENNTDDIRIILMCDVARPLRTWVIRLLNHVVTRYILRATASRNIGTEPIGLLTRLTGVFYRLHDAGQKFKKRNRRTYYALKYTSIVLMLALIFFPGVPRLLTALWK
jgi:beta-hydroxylase